MRPLLLLVLQTFHHPPLPPPPPPPQVSLPQDGKQERSLHLCSEIAAHDFMLTLASLHALVTCASGDMHQSDLDEDCYDSLSQVHT